MSTNASRIRVKNFANINSSANNLNLTQEVKEKSSNLYKQKKPSTSKNHRRKNIRKVQYDSDSSNSSDEVFQIENESQSAINESLPQPDIEIIYLSSDEDSRPVQKVTFKNKKTMTLKHYNILDFFTIDSAIPPTSTSTNINGSPKKTPIKLKKTDSKKTVKKKLPRPKNTLKDITIKRSITNNTNLKWITKKYLADEQKQITNFFQSSETDNLSYFATYPESCLAKTPINAENNFQDDIIDIDEIESSAEYCSGKNITMCLPDFSKLCLPPTPPVSIYKTTKKDTTVQKSKLKHLKGTTRKKPVCPHYKIVEGTTFAVDAFRYGDIDGVTDYFLTHFHSDHYIGLKKSFCKPLYLSKITGRLVSSFIHIAEKYIFQLDINKSFILKDIEITALEANHCPGAVMFLFKFTTGLCTLHTGDFRADPLMEHYPEFWNNTISTIYLDTTYLSRKYDFQSKMHSLQQARRECKKFLNKNIGLKYLIVCGSYTIGKEQVWMEIAQAFNLKVWVEPSRLKALHCIADPLIFHVLVDQPEEAQIHVLQLGSINYQYLSEYIKSYEDHYSVLMAIRPSGWEYNSKPNYGSKISIVGIEYSEHSSFSELERFVRFLQPNKVISTVPNSSNFTETTNIPNSWLSNIIKPKVKAYQSTMTNFVHVRRKSLEPITNEAGNLQDDMDPLLNEGNNHILFDRFSISTDYMS